MTEVVAPQGGVSPLFAQVAASAVADLVSEAHERRLDARQWLFRAGAASDACYVVVSGRLEVVLEHEGDQRVVRVLGPGAALGELGVLTGTRRSASVRALRDSRLVEIDAERFAAHLDHDPAFAAALAREL